MPKNYLKTMNHILGVGLLIIALYWAISIANTVGYNDGQKDMLRGIKKWDIIVTDRAIDTLFLYNSGYHLLEFSSDTTFIELQ